MKKKLINLTDFFSYCGVPSGEIVIVQDSGMYPFNRDFEANWTYYTLKGLPFLRKNLGRIPTNIACVAAGNGVEGIAMGKIFPELENMVLTDIDSEVVAGGLANVLLNLPGLLNQVSGKVGSLCDPLLRTGFKFDIIFGNVPNLICDEKRNLSDGNDKGTFMKGNTLGSDIPHNFVEWGLATQYEFLTGAQKVLCKGGSVVSLIGGRVPGSVIGDLFESCGLKLQLDLPMGFKWQTQPEIDFQGYADLEKKHGVLFAFYLYQEAKEILEAAGISNPTVSISSMHMKDMLEGVEYTATEALELYRTKRAKFGHIVHMCRGVKE